MVLAAYRSLRRKTNLRAWSPRSALGRFTAYLLGIDLLLWIVRRLIKITRPGSGDFLGGWITFLTFIGAVLLLFLAFRWLRRTFMWRLRNRLIVTYIFMAVIPLVLLLTIALGSLYLFAGQFATFLVTSEINSELKSLQTANDAVGHELVVRLQQGGPIASATLEGSRGHKDWTRREVVAWVRGRRTILSSPLGEAVQVSSSPGFGSEQFREVVRDHGQLYLRALTTIPLSNDKLTIVSSEPLDKSQLEILAANLGRISIYGTGFRRVSPESGKPASRPAPAKAGPSESYKHHPESGSVSIRKGGQDYVLDSGNAPLVPSIEAGRLPAPGNALDSEVNFGTSIFVVDWQTGKDDSPAAISVQTRVSRLYQRLFGALGDFAPAVEYFLTLVAVVFGLIELLALFIGIRLTRTITRSVASLYNATQHINRGDFAHRIQIQSQDQLAALEGSFNSMTDSIQKLLAEQKEKQRIENELAIAQEVQAQLFPRDMSALESFEVFGFCRPARTVSGDYYDFLTLSSERLIVAVGDISGKGISAALLMATIHSAVRAYCLENAPVGAPATVGVAAGSSAIAGSNGHGSVPPAVLLSLLNHQLFESTPAEKYATLFLGTYNARARTIDYSNGGHLPPMLIGRDGSVRRLDIGGTVVGLFDHVPFDQGSIRLNDGDIFLAYSDGVTEAENDFGEFGEARLIELVRDHRDLPLARISELLTAAVDDWIGGREQADDITLVLARTR